jgi:hypothetical protein
MYTRGGTVTCSIAIGPNQQLSHNLTLEMWGNVCFEGLGVRDWVETKWCLFFSRIDNWETLVMSEGTLLTMLQGLSPMSYL